MLKPFIFIADLHFSYYSNERINPEDGLPRKLSDIRNTFQNVLRYAVAHDIQEIKIGGDIFHTKSIIHTVAQSILLDIIRSFKILHFTVIDGNHDVSSKSGEGVSALKCLDNEPNVTTIHKTTIGENIYYVPWTSSLISDIRNKPDECNILLSHFGLNEAELHSGISVVGDLGLKDLAKYDQVWLGHYHKPQSLKHVHYVGSLTQLDWGEKHDEKHFVIVNPNDLSFKFVPTEGYKKYFELEIRSKEDKNEIINLANKYHDDGHEVRISVTENLDEHIDIDGVTVINCTEKDITNRGLNTSMTKNEIIDKYMGIQNVPTSDIELFKTVALEIIETSVE